METVLIITAATKHSTWAEARDAAKHPARHGTVPTTNHDWLPPNVNSAEVKRAWLPEVGRVWKGDSLRGYLAPHLGHITFEAFMLNCPWNHTTQNGERKSGPASRLLGRVSPLWARTQWSYRKSPLAAKLWEKLQQIKNLSFYHSPDLQPFLFPAPNSAYSETQHQALDLWGFHKEAVPAFSRVCCCGRQLL